VTYVYFLRSIRFPARTYVGRTANLAERFHQRNASRSPHTAPFRPWQLVVAVWFENGRRATAFERYLKTGSGRSFAQRHFL